MGRLLDFTGRRMGALTVIWRGANDQNGKPRWLCRCDCGQQKLVKAYLLASKQTTSCGCGIHRAAQRASQLQGQRFGRLVAIRKGSAPRPGTSIPWLCRCDCGEEVWIASTHLAAGQTRSCGCLRREMMTTHGHTGTGKERKATPTYRSWTNMVARCTQPSSPNFAHYNRRGIAVCDRWRKFENFLADMGERPPGTSIDRWPNNDGNYEPGNCRWATKTQQSNNTSRNRFFTYRRKRYTLIELARATGVAKETLRVRLVRPGGWDVKKAVETPVIPRQERGRRGGSAGLGRRGQ